MGPARVRLGNALGNAAQAARPPKAPKPPNLANRLGNLPGATLPHNDPGFGQPFTGPHPGQPGYVAPVAATSAPPNAKQAPNILGIIKQGHPNWFPPVAGAPPGSVYHGSSPSGGAGNPAQTAPTATAPANSATTQQPSPLDAAYYAAVNSNTFKVGNQIAGLGLRGTQNDTAFQDTLGQIGYAEPRAQLGLEQRANQGGGLYSSVYGQNLGNLTQGFTDRQSNAQRSHDNTRDSIAGQIAALEGGIPIYNADQAALSAARVAKLTAANPGTGQGTGGLNTHPGAGGSGGGSGSGSGSKSGGKPGSGGGGRNILGIIKQGHPNWFPTVPGAPPGSVYHHGAKPPSNKPGKTLSVRAGQAVSNLRARGY